ncbi:MAG: hypothetical protein IJF15_05195 [Oscillospiraceae bacterium]|nr:hypothetical protein [Oscillospiraceae bacterium]
MSLSGVGGIGAYWYRTALYAPQHAATTAPVEPVAKAPVVERGGRSQIYPTAKQFGEARLPTVHTGADPAEMAVRGRIRYLSDDEVNDLIRAAKGEDGAKGAEKTLTPAEVIKEAECQTCKERKYQDESDDPGVSFQTPTSIDKGQVASAVRGHEYEHVYRERAEAEREGRRVVQQSVTLHTDICPECGEAYVSGGTTRTVTKADPAPEPQEDQQEQQGQSYPGFEAVA